MTRYGTNAHDKQNANPFTKIEGKLLSPRAALAKSIIRHITYAKYN